MTDYISRADAIDAVRSRLYQSAMNNDGEARETFADIAENRIEAWINEVPSADAVPIHEDGTLEVKVPNAHKVGRVLVKDVDSHIGGGLFYPADAEQVTSKLKNPCDSLLTEDSEDSKEQKSKLDHDREWIIGCIKHDGFIKTDRFDKANQIILDALEPQTDTDLISRADVWRKLQTLDMQELYLPIHFKELVLDNVPSVSAERVGEWVYDHHNDEITCSECGRLALCENVRGEDWEMQVYSDYCPWCGARMKGGNDD